MNSGMVMCGSKVIGLFFILSSLAFADERVYRESEDERRWNTPPKLTPEPSNGKSNLDNESIQPRFLPFSASFSLSSAGLPSYNAHSLSIGGSEDGISFSQSTSQAGGASFGNKGISASQSSSFAAGFSGISDSNAFSSSNSAFGENLQANSNSFALGQASSSAHGNVANGQATSAAQSSIGSSHSSANSGVSFGSGFSNSNVHDQRRDRPVWTNIAPNHQAGGLYNKNGGRPKLHVTQGNRGWMQTLPGLGPLRLDVSLDDDAWQNRRPEVTISNKRPTGYRGHRRGTYDAQRTRDEGRRASGNRETWTQSPIAGPSPGMWSRNNEKISGASASSSASTNTPGSLASLGPNGASSGTNNNRFEISSNAQSHAQAGAAAIGQNVNGNSQGSFSSGAIAGASQAHESSYGSAVSGNRGDNSRDYVKFPGEENSRNLPREFVRNASSGNDRTIKRDSRRRDPVGEIITEITDTVADIFDI